jgi:hypothetical protein
MKFLNRLFKLEEINGAERCPTYLYRWTLARIGPYAVYLHHFVGDDWSLDLHDHPKRFVSVGLKGRYLEETPHDGSTIMTQSRVYRAPWVRTFPADHIHRLRMIDGGDCWTLVVTLKATRGWGFWHLGRFIPWRQYVEGPEADRRKACP